MTRLDQLLDRAAADLAAEVDRLVARDPAAPVGRLLALVEVLQRLAASERIGSRHLRDMPVSSLAQWAKARGVSQATAKRKAAGGLIAGAVRVHGAGWVVLGEVEAHGTTHADDDEENRA